MSSSSEKKAEKNGSVSKDQLEAIRNALLEKRLEITRQQSTQISELYNPERHHLADLEEMASDTTDTDSLCAIVDLGSSTIEQIDKAIEKIEDGSYGSCELCEEPIPGERLEILPFAALCVSCQREKETRSQTEEILAASEEAGTARDGEKKPARRVKKDRGAKSPGD